MNFQALPSRQRAVLLPFVRRMFPCVSVKHNKVPDWLGHWFSTRTIPPFSHCQGTSGMSRGIFRFPWWLSSKESTCNAGDTGSVGVRRISWGRAWQPTPVFLPGTPHGHTFLVVTTGEVLLTSSGRRPRVLLKGLQGTGQFPAPPSPPSQE